LLIHDALKRHGVTGWLSVEQGAHVPIGSEALVLVGYLSLGDLGEVAALVSAEEGVGGGHGVFSI
jgi:hypothetical protein